MDCAKENAAYEMPLTSKRTYKFWPEGNAPEPGRPRLARSCMSDPGPRQEAEKAKLSRNRRGVGWVHSTGETLEQSREERWRRGRREGTQSEEEVDAEARPGHSAGFGVSQEAPIRGSNLNGLPKPRTSITFDLRQEPGAGKPHAGICGGGAGYPAPLPDKSSLDR